MSMSKQLWAERRLGKLYKLSEQQIAHEMVTLGGRCVMAVRRAAGKDVDPIEVRTVADRMMEEAYDWMLVGFRPAELCVPIGTLHVEPIVANVELLGVQPSDTPPDSLPTEM